MKFLMLKNLFPFLCGLAFFFNDHELAYYRTTDHINRNFALLYSLVLLRSIKQTHNNAPASGKHQKAGASYHGSL